jgi:FtsH-binding integral membrane protein
METSLYFKTALILSIQLGIIFIGCYYFIKKARDAYQQNIPFLGIRFEGKDNSRGELDLVPISPEPVVGKSPLVNPSPSVKKFIQENEEDKEPTALGALLGKVMWVWFISMFGMIFLAPISTSVGLMLMTITSITFTPMLGAIMLEMDENDGLRAILLTCFITMAAALVGMYSGIDFSFMRGFLFYSLCGLICLGFIRIFFGMTSAMVRAKAIAGAILFTLYLVYDFNRLKNLNDIGVNDWSTALHIAISIYLDVLNLLLEILAAMGDS